MVHVEDVMEERIVGVFGASDPLRKEMEAARQVGALAAKHGWVVLTGGGQGVMEAASQGACEAGGLSLGVLPGSGPLESPPNPWVSIPIYTGMGSARNNINVLSAGFCVAIGGQAGTLSEVALSIKAGKELFWLWPWKLGAPEGRGTLPLQEFSRLPDLVVALEVRFSTPKTPLP